MENTSTPQQLEAALGYRFRSPQLLLQALTHRSWLEEHHPSGHAPAHASQQRLEFLGDAALGFVVALWLSSALPTANEGELTRRRVQFTNGEWLAEVGARLGVIGALRCGKGERARLLINRRAAKDTVEALLGAIVLDGGLDAAARVIHLWLPAEPPALIEDRDPIIVFTEWYQRSFRSPPPEPSFASEGPDHDRVWRCTLHLPGEAPSVGEGHTKPLARRDACQKLLARLGI